MGPSKFLLCLVCFFFSLVGSSSGQDFEGSVSFSIVDLQIDSQAGLDFMRLSEGVLHGEIGAPALPRVQKDVALPHGVEVLGIELLSLETMPLAGTYQVSPMTAPKRIQDGLDQEKPFRKDPAYYEKDRFLPGSYLQLLGTWELVGQRFAKVAFQPVQYNPRSGQVLLATEIRFRIQLSRSPDLESVKTFNLSKLGRAAYGSYMKRKALNPEAVVIPLFQGSDSRALPAGQYEHVIVTPADFSSAWDDLVTWHNRKGFPGTVVTTSYIYSNYSGSDNQEKIRNFVIDAHATWGTRFFLLGADGGTSATQIPYHQSWYDLDDPANPYNVPNDTYYSDYNDDWVVDIHLGRVSVTNTTQIGQFIDKVLYYEKTPSLSDYGNRVCFLGFDLDNYTDGEDTKILIKNNDIPGSIDFEREYDSESGNHLSDVIAYLNSGPNLVNHIDHCNEYVWGMGYTNHSQSFYPTDVNAMTNGWKLINFYTLGCWANAWDVTTSISETFMRKVGGGGISFTGNTRYGWYAQGYVDLYSSLYDMAWWHVLFTDNQYHLGEALTAHKNDYFPDDEYYQYIFDELHALGDPAMPIWMSDPEEMTVFCDDPINTGSQTYTVTVEEGGADLEGALVCLWKDTEVYQFDTSDSFGEVDFTIEPLTAGPMLVTVTAQNCLPYEGSVTVDLAAPPTLVSVSPDHGSSMGGVTCTVVGSYFTSTGDTTVTFDSTPATNVVVLNASTLTCEAPAHGAASVDVTVTTSNGSDTLPAGFTYHNAPTLTSISPDNGPETGGNGVTLTGTAFTTAGGPSVTFDGTLATSVTVVDSTTITCTAPAHAPGAVDVVLGSDFGSSTLSNGYTFNQPPTVSGISPTDGPIAGGTACTLTGTYFTTSVDTSVTFGGVPATSVVVVDANTLTCAAPAQAAGVVDVVLTNSNGSATLTAGFTYHDAPVLASISPDNGPESGGNGVTLTGTAFTTVGNPSVTFDGALATSVTVVDGTTITCTAPAHAPGVVDVVVSSDFGSSTLSNGYTFNQPPTVSGISPTDGPIAGGTACTLTGTYFTTSVDTFVTFGGVPATSVVVVDANTLTCAAPAQAAGVVDVVLTNSNGSATLASSFTYHNPPDLFAVSPDNGPQTGGMAITLTGTDFTTLGTTYVTLDGAAASSVIVVDSATITCTVPAHAPDTVDVVVSNDFGSSTLSNGYRYNEPPTVSAISPTDGPIAGGTACTLIGAYFTTTLDTSVTFGGVPATSVVVVDTGTLTCTAPAHAAGVVDVVLTNSNGSATLFSGFTYHDTPILTSITPDHGPETGGNGVTLTGTAFTTAGNPSVTFDGALATSVTVVDGTTITCTVPAHAPGAVDVLLSNDFGSSTLSNGYTFNQPPTVSGLSPTDGPIAGGTACTLTGTYFTTSVDTSVTFGGVSATSVVVVDANTLTCAAPAFAAGIVDVVLTNSNGSATLASSFTYHNPPSLFAVSPDNGPQTGNMAITLTGTDFTTLGTTYVTLDGAAASSVIVVDSATITCTVPAHAPGTVDVVVSHDFGSGTLSNGYTYNESPTVSAISPADGPIAGGTACTLTGAYFTTTLDTNVTFGGAPATSVVVVDTGTLTCTAPAHAAGVVDVVLTNSNGSATLISAFTYHNAPTITAVSPSSGPDVGGTSVALTGTDFTPSVATSVTFDGVPATQVTVLNATTLTCSTPAHAPGVVDVMLINEYGTGTLVGGYTYVASQASILQVPGEYASIQLALDAASLYVADTILVAPGTYLENLDFLGKTVTLRSDRDGDPMTLDLAAVSTVIDGGQTGSVVRFISGEGKDTVLEGFTLTNGSGTVIGAGTRGGAIYCDSSSPMIRGNVFHDNHAQITGGAIACFSSASRLVNNVFYNNSSYSGGAVFTRSSYVSLISNTVFANSAVSSGGGLYLDQGASLMVKNCIFSANQATDGSEVYIGYGGIASSMAIDYSNVQGGTGMIHVDSACTLDWGDGMLETDPVLADPMAGDWHLTKGSDCVDAGDNTVPLLATRDLDGDPRVILAMGGIYPIKGDHLHVVDMGADELYVTKKTLLKH